MAAGGPGPVQALLDRVLRNAFKLGDVGERHVGQIEHDHGPPLHRRQGGQGPDEHHSIR